MYTDLGRGKTISIVFSSVSDIDHDCRAGFSSLVASTSEIIFSLREYSSLLLDEAFRSNDSFRLRPIALTVIPLTRGCNLTSVFIGCPH